MPGPINRRQAFSVAALGAASATSLMVSNAKAADARPADEPFGYCMNTSTIRGQKLPYPEKLQAIARAGFRAIEPWFDEIGQYLNEGGTVKDLRKILDDLGLSIESAIGFHEWIVDDDTRRAAGLEQAKKDMHLIAQLGGKRIAAPPAGATDQTNLDLRKAAERYRALLEIGASIGVIPQVELWGFSKSLSKLAEVSFIAIESGHPDACLLLDTYHLYKGGTAVDALKLVGGQGMHVMHLNDYPADPPREKIGDALRVYPGDGVAPLKQIFRALYDNGYRGYLSLEIFNQDVWNKDALLACRMGYEKMQAAVKAAFA